MMSRVNYFNIDCQTPLNLNDRIVAMNIRKYISQLFLEKKCINTSKKWQLRVKLTSNIVFYVPVKYRTIWKKLLMLWPYDIYG